ncbi:MAG: hypothetical protein HY815_26675 [Candidatus Riflebacteria bacterium]|nr:hypothetical protein [Candidatus Riflebacteria bacterium]
MKVLDWLWRLLDHLGLRHSPIVHVDDAGVMRLLPDDRVERVSWTDLWAIEIVTTSDGPLAEDVFFVLHGRHGSGCVVPLEVAVEIGLLDWFQILPGFDHEAVVRALGSQGEGVFLCWTRPGHEARSEGLLGPPLSRANGGQGA